MKTLTAICLLTFSVGAFSNNKNCKLSMHTLSTSGKKRVEIVEVAATSREDCKRLAKEREVIKEGDDITNIRVVFSWRPND